MEKKRVWGFKAVKLFIEEFLEGRERFPILAFTDGKTSIPYAKLRDAQNQKKGTGR